MSTGRPWFVVESDGIDLAPQDPDEWADDPQLWQSFLFSLGKLSDALIALPPHGSLQDWPLDVLASLSEASARLRIRSTPVSCSDNLVTFYSPEGPAGGFYFSRFPGMNEQARRGALDVLSRWRIVASQHAKRIGPEARRQWLRPGEALASLLLPSKTDKQKRRLYKRILDKLPKASQKWCGNRTDVDAEVWTHVIIAIRAIGTSKVDDAQAVENFADLKGQIKTEGLAQKAAGRPARHSRATPPKTRLPGGNSGLPG